MKAPLVSIVMVNYNHEDYLRESIDSVIAQTYPNWELIIVDDGSTDDSVKIIGSYGDPRIKPYFFEYNRHICHATNYGFEKVSGEYVARLDSDDVWRADKLEKQIAFFQNHPQAEVCFTKLDIIDSNGKNNSGAMIDFYNLYNSRQDGQKGWLRFFFFVGNSLIQSTLMLKAALLREIGGFNLAYMQAHDFDFFIRLIKKTDFHFIEEPLVGYRRMEEQNSSSHPEKDRRFFNEYMNIRFHFFDDFPEELFVEVFQEYFVCPDSFSRDELRCEQAFLLCRCIGYSGANPVLGLMKLEELFAEPRLTKLLEEKFHYTPKDFYKESGKYLFYSPELEAERKRAREDVRRLTAENEGYREHIKALLELKEAQQRYIEHMQNTASWKITKPLRDVKEIIRRKK